MLRTQVNRPNAKTILQRLEHVLERFHPPSHVEEGMEVDTADINDPSYYFTANDISGMFLHSP